MAAENLENKIFMHWTVINRAENSIQGSARWNCECVCGLKKTIAAADLKRGTSTSCGCKGRKQVLINEKYNRLTVIEKLGRNLNAHHIENFSSNIEKRIDLNNGITLCKKCHLEFHNKNGKSLNNKRQLEKFLGKLA